MIAGLLRFVFTYLILGVVLRMAFRAISQFRERPVSRGATPAAGVEFPEAQDVDFEEIRQDR